MSERAAVYTVAVARRGAARPSRRWANLREGRLADELDCSTGSSRRAPTADGRCTSSQTQADGDDLFAVLQHGQAGVAAEIVDAAGDVRLQRTPDDVAARPLRLPLPAAAGGRGGGARPPRERRTRGRRSCSSRACTSVSREARGLRARDSDGPTRKTPCGRPSRRTGSRRCKLVKIESSRRSQLCRGRQVGGDGRGGAGRARRRRHGIEPALIGRHLAGDAAAHSPRSSSSPA